MALMVGSHLANMTAHKLKKTFILVFIKFRLVILRMGSYILANFPQIISIRLKSFHKTVHADLHSIFSAGALKWEISS